MLSNCCYFPKTPPSAGFFAANVVVGLVASPLIGLALLIGSVISLIITLINWLQLSIKKALGTFEEEERQLREDLLLLHDEAVDQEVQKIIRDNADQPKGVVDQLVFDYRKSADAKKERLEQEQHKISKKRSQFLTKGIVTSLCSLSRQCLKAFLHMLVITYPVHILIALHCKNLLTASGEWDKKMKVLNPLCSLKKENQRLG